jgi:hypothetical protein
MVIGSLGLIWGEQRCLHLKLPLEMTYALPGRRFLQVAYWCHMAGIFARLFRQWGGRGVGLITLPLNVLGFIFLLLFLRKIARTIVRNDLRRLIDTVFGLAAAAAASAALIPIDTALGLGVLRMIGPLAAIGMLCLPVLFFIAMIVAYALLLWRMGTAARDFARFLSSAGDTASAAGDDEQLAGAPEGA